MSPRLSPTRRRSTRWVTLALALVSVFGASSASAATRFVLAIGNDVGGIADEPLRWAEADAVRVHDVMVELGGVTSGRAQMLLGTGAVDVERALLVLGGQIAEARRRGDRTELFVSYAGHGDQQALHVGRDLLATKRLLSLIDDAAADASVVIIDACRSGVVRAGRGRGATAGPRFDVQLIDELAPVGRVVIASASDGEVAQESDDLEGAFFTHHLLAGLRGAGDVDDDGTVTIAELYAYAHARTVRQSFAQAAVQHPELVASLRGQGELVMTRLDRGAAGLRLAADVDGRVLVADARSGRVLFEVEKSAGAPMRLAVPARRLHLLVRSGRETRVGEVDMQRGRESLVAFSDLQAAPRLAGRTRASDLDVTPWGLALGLSVASPVSLPMVSTKGDLQPALGLTLLAERRLLDTPIFGGLQLGVSRAGGDVTGISAVVGGQDMVFSEMVLRAQLPFTIEAWSPLGRFTAGIAPGVEVVVQDVARTDTARLRQAGFDVASASQHQSLGPLLSARGGWWVPIWGSVAVSVVVEGGASVHAVDGVLQPVPYGSLSSLVGVEL